MDSDPTLRGHTTFRTSSPAPLGRRGGWLASRTWPLVATGGSMLMAAACGGDDTVITGAGGSGGRADSGADVAQGGGTGTGGGAAGSEASRADGSGGSATGGSTGIGGAPSEGGGLEAASDAFSCPDGGDPKLDSDNDGFPDCIDGCPLDTLKSGPGVCGCGVPDVDGDRDGTLDCNDACPADGTKITPGICGCGVSDTQDTDRDGRVDCLDACPRDPLQMDPGPCGCVNIVGDPLCLAHRYSFNGAGTIATDTGRAPAANGTVFNTVLGTEAGPGAVSLAGGISDQYVALPPNIISTMGKSATIETWVTWSPTNPAAPDPWQRIFDFGSSDNGPQQGNGVTYFFLTPWAGGSTLPRAVVTVAGIGGETLVEGGMMPMGVMTHLAVVVDGSTNTMTLYLNGAVVPAGSSGAVLRPGATLPNLDDSHIWLGRSQFAADREFAGTLFEFRIYSRALSAAQIVANGLAGPDTLAGVVDGGAADATTDRAADAAADVTAQ